jgi:hypothetical protein
MEDMEWPKWPKLLMVGETVKPEQAMEILIRTNHWYMLEYNYDQDIIGETIKKFYTKTLASEYQIGENKIDGEDLIKKLDALELNYLENARIQSSWIGGLKGWMNWDGKLFTNNYNIGKWPTEDELIYDIKTIINTFPYLDFELQLVRQDYSDSGDMEKQYPFFTCRVKNKDIKIIKKQNLITRIEDDGDGMSSMNDHHLLEKALMETYHKTSNVKV